MAFFHVMIALHFNANVSRWDFSAKKFRKLNFLQYLPVKLKSHPLETNLKFLEENIMKDVTQSSVTVWLRSEIKEKSHGFLQEKFEKWANFSNFHFIFVNLRKMTWKKGTKRHRLLIAITEIFYFLGINVCFVSGIFRYNFVRKSVIIQLFVPIFLLWASYFRKLSNFYFKMSRRFLIFTW